MIILKKLLPLIIVLVFSFFAFKPLLSSGFFPIHDNTQVQRVFEMTKSLRDGMLPVRWVADLGFGYGYPMFNFYAPAPYYAGSVFSLLGLDALSATKLMMLLGIVTAGVSMYFLASEFWGKLGGILSALFYMYAPYHAVDIYVRGDVAEFWAYAFIPLVFYGLWKIYKEKKWRYVVVGSLSYAFIICSHNLTAMMVTPFIAFIVLSLSYLAYKKKQVSTIYYLLFTVFLGLMISAFYWLPALLEMGYTNVLSQLGGGANFRDNFVCPIQLWTSPWGFGGSVKGCSDGLSFMIGKYHIIVSTLIFLLSAVWYKYSKKFREDRGKLMAIIISFFGFLLSAFFTLQISDIVWEAVKPMAFFQYPWRFLLMTSFFSSFISGASIWILNKFIKNNYIIYLISFFAFVMIVFVSFKFFYPQVFLNVTSSDYTNQYTLGWTTSNITSEYMPKDFQKPENPNGLANFSKLSSKDLVISNLSRNTKNLSMDIRADKSSLFLLPVAYFPSWRASLDGKNTTVLKSGKGIIVNIPKGVHFLKLSFVQTPVEKAGDLLSLAGVLLLFAGIIYLRVRYD